MSEFCLLLYRKYLLELVHRSLEQITSSQESSWDRLPVSVDNMLFLADQFVLAVDMLPTLLVHSDDSEKQVCLCLVLSQRLSLSQSSKMFLQCNNNVKSQLYN